MLSSVIQAAALLFKAAKNPTKARVRYTPLPLGGTIVATKPTPTYGF